jgi:hypothetical protein
VVLKAQLHVHVFIYCVMQVDENYGWLSTVYVKYVVYGMPYTYLEALSFAARSMYLLCLPTCGSRMSRLSLLGSDFHDSHWCRLAARASLR